MLYVYIHIDVYIYTYTCIYIYIYIYISKASVKFAWSCATLKGLVTQRSRCATAREYGTVCGIRCERGCACVHTDIYRTSTTCSGPFVSKLP